MCVEFRSIRVRGVINLKWISFSRKSECHERSNVRISISVTHLCLSCYIRYIPFIYLVQSYMFSTLGN